MKPFDCSVIQNTLSNAFKSMDSHFCTKIIFLGTFCLYKYYAVTFLYSDGDRQVFHGDMLIDIRVFFSYLSYHC